MTNDQFAELKSLIRINYDMLGRTYEEHSARFDRVEERLSGLEGRVSGVESRLEDVERELKDFRGEWRSTHTQFERRLRALEN